jgi:hypothetical protein
VRFTYHHVFNVACVWGLKQGKEDVAIMRDSIGGWLGLVVGACIRWSLVVFGIETDGWLVSGGSLAVYAEQSGGELAPSPESHALVFAIGPGGQKTAFGP